MIVTRRWGPMHGAIELTDGGLHAGYASHTSTSTILVDDASGSKVLRMFDVGSCALNLAFKKLAYSTSLEDNDPAASYTCPSTEEWLSFVCFLDSDTSLDFTVEGTATSNPTTMTNIPNTKSGENWLYETVDSFELATPHSFRAVTTQVRDEMMAFYKDPCVIALPAGTRGGYLMILVRGRVLKAHLIGHYYTHEFMTTGKWPSTAPTASQLVEYLAKHRDFGEAIFDIVCYYSESDPAFGDGNTRGPYLLVHSMDALSDPHVRELGYSDCRVAFRCALGVPAAAFADGSLYLYYVAMAMTESETDPWLGANTSLDRVIAEYDNGAGFTEATVVRRIDLFDIVESIVNTDPPPPENDWTEADAVPGDPSVPVRVWKAIASTTRLEVEPLEDACLTVAQATSATYTRARIVDPLPVSDGANALDLFFALRPERELMIITSDNLLFGIWRSAGIPSGEVLNHAGRRFVTEPGRDFVVSVLSPITGSSPDQVDWCRVDGSFAYDFMDPDVVRIDSGWRVHCYDYYELVYYEVVEERVHASWEDAWEAAWVLEEP